MRGTTLLNRVGPTGQRPDSTPVSIITQHEVDEINFNLQHHSGSNPPVNIDSTHYTIQCTADFYTIKMTETQDSDGNIIVTLFGNPKPTSLNRRIIDVHAVDLTQGHYKYIIPEDLYTLPIAYNEVNNVPYAHLWFWVIWPSGVREKQADRLIFFRKGRD